ncbi:MAG: class I SAM-dependent methyltransferase [Chitinophagaceae bacterium]
MRGFLFLLLLLSLKVSGQGGAAQPDVAKLKQARLDTMVAVIGITGSDIVADIGSGNGYNLIRLSKYFPPARYYAEDIDSARCNRENFKKTIRDFRASVSIDSFTFRYGTTAATNLPENFFTKVLMIAVVHEFDEKQSMFADIRSILQPGGFIFIEEPLVIHPVPKDKGCNNPYLTEAQLKRIISDNGLEIVMEKYIPDLGDNKYRKIFKCRLKTASSATILLQ